MAVSIPGATSSEWQCCLCRGETLTGNNERWPKWLGCLLCRLGLHDLRVVDVTFGFGPSGQVEHVERLRIECCPQCLRE